MTKTSSTFNSMNSNELSPQFQAIEEKTIDIANKLQSGFALNQENYELLVNNLSMRIKHKKFMGEEDKEFLISLVSSLATAQNGQSDSTQELSKAELKAIENLKIFISQKEELRDALEQSVVENQNALIEEEKVIEFLERNHTSNLEALETHLQTSNPSELLTTIFEINDSLSEKDKIENNPSLYLTTGGMFGGLTKLKVSLFSDKPQSISTLQSLVNQYENKKDIILDLKNLKTYLLQTASLEEAADEGEKKLNDKRQEIEELIKSIEGGQKKMTSLNKEITTAAHQLEELAPEAQRLSFKEAVDYFLENLSLFITPENVQNENFKNILLKTYGPHFESELPNIIKTYESVNTDLAQTVESLENVIQLNQSQKKQYDFALKRSFSTEEKQAHEKKLLNNQGLVLSHLGQIEEKVASFFKAAFDSDMADYLDNSLAQNDDLKAAQNIIVALVPVLSSLDSRSKPSSSNVESASKNKI